MRLGSGQIAGSYHRVGSQVFLNGLLDGHVIEAKETIEIFILKISKEFRKVI